jgi:hypothetical protein
VEQADRQSSSLPFRLESLEVVYCWGDPDLKNFALDRLASVIREHPHATFLKQTLNEFFSKWDEVDPLILKDHFGNKVSGKIRTRGELSDWIEFHLREIANTHSLIYLSSTLRPEVLPALSK